MLTKHNHPRRALALLLAVLMTLALLPTTALAGQEDGYHDPAERWMNAVNRTNELDVNSTVTYETFHCSGCHLDTSFRIWRTPEYTRDGQTAMTRNVRYSDGTLYGGEGTGIILDGTPGVDATYTGYHWTKSCCTACGTMNGNMGSSDYSFGKNVYWLYDCAAEFTEQLDDVVTYTYADAAYHTKSVDGGTYCEFCYGTRHTHTETLERHTLHTDVLPQIDKQRFAIVTHCEKCDYADYEFVAAKAVIADYYGVVDGQAHTLTVTDLSEPGVTAVIRYGNSADACTMATPPSFTEEGQYTVYYEITYTYQGVDMTENGVAYVWLRDDSLPEFPGCGCGCGDPDCDCGNGGDCPHCRQFDCTRNIHNFIFIDTVPSTCMTLGYDRWFCPLCGLIEKRNYVNASGHVWQSVVIREADCEHGGKVLDICQGCGETRVTVTEKGEHSWQTYNVEATCTSPGYTLSECSRCGERRITNIGAVLGHSYQSYTTPATCVTGGMTLHICDRCGQSYADNYTQATDHRWNAGVVVVASTCISEGLKEFTCENCGITKSEAIPATGHKPGPAATCTEAQLCAVCGAVLDQVTGHNYTSVVTAPTCGRMGYTTYSCINCGDTYRSDYTDALGHSYTAAVTAPTCTEMGFTTYTCSRCHSSYEDHYLPALGHDWDKGTVIASATCNGAGVVEHRCTRCDANYLEAVDAAGHKPGSAATCTDAQLCIVCGAVIAPARGHRYAAAVTAPTCNTLGFTTYVCKDCDDSYRGDYTDALGHSYVSAVTPATCLTDGYTTYTCTRCGDSYVTDRIPALGHRYDAGTVLVKPSCTTDGIKLYVCSGCGHEHSEAIPATGHTPGAAATCTEAQYCTTCGAILTVAHGHAFKTERTEATCEGMGWTTYTCDLCGLNYRSDYTEPLGHSYTAAVTPPTCTEPGYTTYTCTRCGNSYVDGYISPKGHRWDGGTPVTDATCTGDGVTIIRCRDCSAAFLKAVSATGHIPGAPASCTEPQLCTVCGAVLAQAKGHRYTAAVTAPTCRTMGYTTYTCADCGDSYRADYVDALGHDYQEIVTPPTCTTAGYSTFVCTRCDASFAANRTEATGHAWDNGTVLVNPSCTGDGLVEYRCVDCDKTRNETLPALGHVPGAPATCTEPMLCETCGAILALPQGHSFKTTVTAPSCTEMGFTTYACVTCGYEFSADYTNPVGHAYRAEVTPPTCTEAGYTVWTCANCGDSYTDSYVAPLGHDWDEGTAITDATCNGKGVMEYRCRRCDKTYLEATDATGHTPGTPATCTEPQLCTVCGAVLQRPLGHNYESAVTPPTCLTMGYTTYSCADCGDSYRADYVDALGHNFEVEITPPTCIEEGYTTYTCARCGESFVTDRVEATGHRWDDGTILVKPSCTGEGLLEFCCTACDKTRSETLPALGHVPGEAATCTQPQLCDVCGAVLERAIGHSYTEEVIAPTCTEMGFTIYTCSGCGDRYKGDYTDPIGHNFEAVVTEPTCTEAGYTVWTCANCGDSYTDSYVAPLDHDWDEGTAITDATCNGKGVLEHRCARCDKTYLEATDATGHTPGAPATCTEPQLCTVCGALLENAKGHRFEAEVTEPTCLRMGWTTYVCADCGETYHSDYTDPTGHDYIPYVTDPTCTEGGFTTYVCANCGDSFSVRFTAPLGHDWIGTMISEPCCTGDGVVEYTCSRCGERYCANIPATGHTPGSPATCINPQICLDCGAVLAFATGHDYKAIVTPPTCEKLGWTTYVCRSCGESYKSDYTDPIGHDYEPYVTPPTCIEMGYTTWVCANCGDSYVADYTEPTGHTWDEGTVLIESSCNGEGLIDHRCVICDYHYLEPVSPVGHIPGPEADCIHPQLCTVCGAVLVQALGHRYEAAVTAPTCTEMGYTTYTCTRCGQSHKDDYTKPTGHTESDWIIDTEPTADAEGLRHKVCTVCGITLISETMEKLYRTATTDSKGEAVVGAYFVIVTDTNSGDPVPSASVVLNADNTLSIRLPEGRLLDYAAQTTVTVLLREDKAARSEMQPVVGLFIAVSDKNGNYCAEKTNADGQITVPGSSGTTGPDGTVTFGWKDADGNRFTITIRIADYENGRPIIGAIVTIGKTGHITVVLPNGIDMDAANRIIITLTNQRKVPLVGWIVFVKGDRTDENGETDENGTLILPEIVRREKHAAYIVGYPDGTFGPERGMTRAEATAIYARLLADKKGDTVVPVENTKFADIPKNAWYSGYVKYLNNYGAVYGKEDGNFDPDAAISRAEFVAMAVRFFEVYGDGNPTIMEQYAEFTDISDGYWAAQYIRDAAIYGWIRGYGDGTFRATQAITRAEVVTIVNRLLDRTADKAYLARNLRSLNTFSDMDDTHWAYYAVLEAANAHTAVYDPAESWTK